MLCAKQKKMALDIHEKAVDKYNDAFHKMERLGGTLNERRQECRLLIQEIEILINSIANQPRKFEKKISGIQAEQVKFKKTEEYAAKAMKATVKSAALVATGVAAASLAPSAVMWITTAFGPASAGAAISAFYAPAMMESVMSSVSYAAMAVGGTGAAAGGNALLALVGPIGWGIAGANTVASAINLGRKNKKIADDVIADAKNITAAGAKLDEASAKIQYLLDKTVMLMDSLRDAAQIYGYLKGANYTELSEEDQHRLGAIVNSTLALAEMLNQTI